MEKLPSRPNLFMDPATGLSSATVSNPTANPTQRTLIRKQKPLLPTDCTATATSDIHSEHNAPDSKCREVIYEDLYNQSNWCSHREKTAAAGILIMGPSSGLSSSNSEQSYKLIQLQQNLHRNKNYHRQRMHSNSNGDK